MTAPQLLRYRIDILSVLTVIAALAVQITALLQGWPWYTVGVIFALVRQVNLIEHNHAHLRIFHQRPLNEFVGWMCFLSNGVPLEFYELHHVRNHHRYNQRFDGVRQDWSSLFGFRGTRQPDRPVGLGYYVLTFPLLTICHCLIHLARVPGTDIFMRFLRSTLVVGLVSAVLLAYDPWRFVAFFLVPWIAVFFALGWNNYTHHLGCQLTSPYDSCNVHLRPQYRALGFNIGYHTAHHLKPAVHWSELPTVHESIKAHIPAENYRPHRSAPDVAAVVADAGEAVVESDRS